MKELKRWKKIIFNLMEALHIPIEEKEDCEVNLKIKFCGGNILFCKSAKDNTHK